jgi:hypothetical protein
MKLMKVEPMLEHVHEQQPSQQPVQLLLPQILLPQHACVPATEE